MVFAILQQLRVKASGLFRLKSQFRSAPRSVQSVQPVGVRLQRFFVLDQRFPWPAQLQQHVSQHLPGRQLDSPFPKASCLSAIDRRRLRASSFFPSAKDNHARPSSRLVSMDLARYAWSPLRVASTMPSYCATASRAAATSCKCPDPMALAQYVTARARGSAVEGSSAEASFQWHSSKGGAREIARAAIEITVQAGI